MPLPRAGGDQDRLSYDFLGKCAGYILIILLGLTSITPAGALQTVPGSPCADTCSQNNLNYANDTVCLDAAFQTGGGQDFRQCTTCLLNSTAVDTANNISDVYWGLCESRLRYRAAL